MQWSLAENASIKSLQQLRLGRLGLDAYFLLGNKQQAHASQE